MGSHFFCNHFNAKTTISKSQTSKIRIRNRLKKWPETKKCKLLDFKKLIYTGPKIIPKSMKILLRTTSCPSCCSHGPPRCSRGAKMGCQNAKKKAPSFINGNPRSKKKHDMLKWLLGCSRGVKMVPKINIRRFQNHPKIE